MRPTVLVLAALVIASACSGDTDSADPTPAPTATPVPVTAAIPGGGSADELAAAGLLDGAGRVAYGPVVPDEEFDGAICEYLFGSPTEVAALVGLPADTMLVDDSGPVNLGGGGTGVRCGYGDGDEAALVARIWSDPADADNGAKSPVEVEVGGHWAWLGFHPDYAGEPLDDGTARDWLTAAGERWSGGQV